MRVRVHVDTSDTFPPSRAHQAYQEAPARGRFGVAFFPAFAVGLSCHSGLSCHFCFLCLSWLTAAFPFLLAVPFCAVSLSGPRFPFLTFSGSHLFHLCG
ncbi:hypothetical protein [Streptomyces sp. 8L]|uniref:hypothetical protein n=1 Tax=Streptomyces sp. 8L TaxID=2877242 RepID=UPI001CD26133|nr:hypothetical protein [Streptomyces sp. 8L]MCA1221844.1 hypothetical protein [Streptomyces sp. 8L]